MRVKGARVHASAFEGTIGNFGGGVIAAFGGKGSFGRSSGLSGFNASATQAARGGSNRSASCRHALLARSSSVEARQVSSQKCWPHFKPSSVNLSSGELNCHGSG